jgi:hypothetical protein
MRSVTVVATTARGTINKFEQPSLMEARNLKDFLEQTGDYATVGLYELEISYGPFRKWAELRDAPA